MCHAPGIASTVLKIAVNVDTVTFLLLPWDH